MFKGVDTAIGDFDYFVQDYEGGLAVSNLKWQGFAEGRRYLKGGQFDESFNGFGIDFNCPLDLLPATSQSSQSEITIPLHDTLKSR
jgi:hypothetical protein